MQFSLDEAFDQILEELSIEPGVLFGYRRVAITNN